MRNKRPLVLLLLACCLAQPVFGQSSFGTLDCGQWMKKTDSVGIKNARETWLAGYMSGLNTMYWVEEDKKAVGPWINPWSVFLSDDPLRKVNSFDQLILWMDNYCTKNPLSTVQKGGLALFTELRDK